MPQFKQEKFQKGDTLRLCLKGSPPVTSLQYVFEGVKSLQKGLGDQPNVEIIIMGRLKQLPKSIISQDVYHDMTRLVDEGDYYKFEETMSKCMSCPPPLNPSMGRAW